MISRAYLQDSCSSFSWIQIRDIVLCSPPYISRPDQLICVRDGHEIIRIKLGDISVHIVRFPTTAVPTHVVPNLQLHVKETICSENSFYQVEVILIFCVMEYIIEYRPAKSETMYEYDMWLFNIADTFSINISPVRRTQNLATEVVEMGHSVGRAVVYIRGDNE